MSFKYFFMNKRADSAGRNFMTQKKTDRRILRTIRMIDEAMMDLLEDKPISEIGVTELCERADINRNTFYCHYNSPVDVLSHLEENIMEEISKALSASADSVEATQTTLRVLSENKRMAKILLSDNVGVAFTEKLIQLTTARNLSIAKRQYSRLSNEYQMMLSEFSIAGGAAVVRHWALNDMKESPEDVAKFIRIVSNHGSQSIQHNPAPEFR